MCVLGGTHMNPEPKIKYRRYAESSNRSAVERQCLPVRCDRRAVHLPA
jgi:hypothetical protein